MDECRAVELLKAGNLEGLEILVRLFYFQAVRVSYLIVQDSALAEDIVQDAFIHAQDKIAQLSSDRFRPWFMRMVINASLQAAKKQKRQVSLGEADEETAQFLAGWLVDKRPSPEEMVETEDLRQGVWKALSQLKPDQRAAVVMKYFLDMSEADITRELNTPLSTIKWRLFAAREKLRSLLNPLRGSPSTRESENDPPYSKDKE